MNYYNRMTLEQRNVVDAFKEGIEAEIQLCLERLHMIDSIGCKGHVPLPATSASGEPVIHGANMAIFFLRNYYLKRLGLIKYIDTEIFEALVPRNYQSEL